jgi:hypothetical protein
VAIDCHYNFHALQTSREKPYNNGKLFDSRMKFGGNFAASCRQNCHESTAASASTGVPWHAIAERDSSRIVVLYQVLIFRAPHRLHQRAVLIDQQEPAVIADER